MYLSGLRDDSKKILRKLRRRLGDENYDFVDVTPGRTVSPASFPPAAGQAHGTDPRGRQDAAASERRGIAPPPPGNLESSPAGCPPA